MDAESVIETARDILLSAQDHLLDPQPRECLLCFVARQLSEYGCNGSHRFTLRYRDLVAPRATALIKRLSRMGACCCDCEVFMNAFALSSRYVTPGYWYMDEQGFDVFHEPQAPDPLPRCHGVRRGSTQPCQVWERRYRGYR